jgi:hypothetical protein
VLINSTGYFALVWSALILWIVAVLVTGLVALRTRSWIWLLLAAMLLVAGLIARAMLMAMLE